MRGEERSVDRKEVRVTFTDERMREKEQTVDLLFR